MGVVERLEQEHQAAEAKFIAVNDKIDQYSDELESQGYSTTDAIEAAYNKYGKERDDAMAVMDYTESRLTAALEAEYNSEENVASRAANSPVSTTNKAVTASNRLSSTTSNNKPKEQSNAELTVGQKFSALGEAIYGNSLSSIEKLSTGNLQPYSASQLEQKLVTASESIGKDVSNGNYANASISALSTTTDIGTNLALTNPKITEKVGKVNSEIQEFRQKHSTEIRIAEELMKSTLGSSVVVNNGNVNYVSTLSNVVGLSNSNNSTVKSITNSQIAGSLSNIAGGLLGGSNGSSSSRTPTVDTFGSSGATRGQAVDRTEQLLSAQPVSLDQLKAEMQSNSEVIIKGRVDMDKFSRNIDLHSDNIFAILVEPYDSSKGGLGNAVPKNPYSNIFNNGWMPVLDFSLSLDEVNFKEFGSIPEVGLMIPIGFKTSTELRMTVLEDNTYRVFNYLSKYKKVMTPERRTARPYQLCCSLITIYLYNKQMRVVREAKLLAIPNINRELGGTDSFSIKTLEISWNVVGELIEN